MEVRKRLVKKSNRKSKSWNSKGARIGRPTDWKKYSCTIVLVIVFAISVIAMVLRFYLYAQNSRSKLVLTDPDIERPPSHSVLHKYKKAAVSSDAVPCSKIGKEILLKNGSAVDAAVATLLCSGIVNMESMGIGGGFIMTVYVRSERKPYSIIAREAAPLAAHENMFSGSHGDSLYEPSRTGGLAVGVPGELKGYWEVWKRFGRLPWRELVAPSISLCYEGYELSKPQRDALLFRPDTPKADLNLRSWFVDKDSGDFKRWGSSIIPLQLCKTYERIADEGGLVLHGGSLMKTFIQDLQALDGILTEQDMRSYSPDWTEPLTIKLGEDIMFTAPPPGSGALLCHILLILKGYKFGLEDFTSITKSVTSYHRVLEAFKYAFAKRGLLGDPNFVDVSKALESLTEERYASQVRRYIDDGVAFSSASHYGAVESKSNDYGTNHISIISPDGDAVSVTSTINLYFGAGFTSTKTGILLNSVMDDFSIPNVTNYFDFLPSSQNFIEAGKKPMSSAAPTVIVDKNGDVKLVIGASGGSRIITAVALIILRFLWLDQDLKNAIDASRVHHQLTPMIMSYEYGLLKEVLDGLKKLGHAVERATVRGSVVSAVAQINGTLFGNPDFRKFGGVDGFD